MPTTSEERSIATTLRFAAKLIAAFESAGWTREQLNGLAEGDKQVLRDFRAVQEGRAHIARGIPIIYCGRPASKRLSRDLPTGPAVERFSNRLAGEIEWDGTVRLSTVEVTSGFVGESIGSLARRVKKLGETVVGIDELEQLRLLGLIPREYVGKTLLALGDILEVAGEPCVRGISYMDGEWGWVTTLFADSLKEGDAAVIITNTK